MKTHRHPGSRRRGVAAIASTVLATLATGCGFTPMYATPGLSAGLSSIQVVAPQGRVGFLMGQDLNDDLAHDRATPPVWRLTLDVVQSRDPRGLSLANVAERYELTLKVHYVLTEIATGKVVRSGDVLSQESYDAANAPYAGIAGRQDSQDRVASDAAQRIRIQLAAWMAARDRK